MFEFIEEIVSTVLNETSHPAIYSYLFLLMFMNSSVMVPPSEYICIVAGIIYFNRDVNLVLLVIIAAAANFLGMSVWYLVGKIHVAKSKTIVKEVYENEGIRTKIHRLYTQRLTQLEELYKTHGVLLMILLRNVPIIRSIASYPAGRIGMPFWVFTWSSMIGITIWVSLWIGVGYFLGNIAYHYKWYIALGVGIMSIVLIKLLLTTLDKRVVMKESK